MRLKPIFTWSKVEKKIRLFRVLWADDHRCFSIALMPNLFQWRNLGIGDKRLVLFGVSFHYMRSFGGRFA